MAAHSYHLMYGESIVSTWIKQRYDMFDSLLFHGIKNPEAILQPLPMTKQLRFIGGVLNGARRNVPDTASGYGEGLAQYERRTLTYGSSTFTFREEVMALRGLTNDAALLQLVALPMPPLRVPKFVKLQVEDSSVIDEIGYDKTLGILQVEMVSGTYRYENVPQFMVTNFLMADSKGQFYNAHIKGKFPAVKV